MPEAARALLTIVVPSFNRPAFLARLLGYYEACGAPFPLHILDSSHAAGADPRVRKLCAATQAAYRRYDAAMLPTLKIADGLQHVTTPYVVLWADDDLMVPRGLAAGVGFLEAHPEFSVAHGRSGLFQTGVVQGRTALLGVQPYPQRAYTAPQAAQRVTECLTDYTTNLFYSVHRTAQLRDNVQRCLAYGLGVAHPPQPIHRADWWVELTLACLSIIHGKAWQVGGLYMMRDRHEGADSWELGSAKIDHFDWVVSDSFSVAHRAFTECVAGALARQDGLSPSQAEAVVKRAFWSHLARILGQKWHGRYAAARGSWRVRLRDGARRIPGVRTAWRRAQALLPHPADEISLPALLQPSSTYYEDFQPVYRAILAGLGLEAGPRAPAELECEGVAVS